MDGRAPVVGPPERHRLPVEKLVTHRFAIDDAEAAFRMFDARETEKAVFVWDGAA